MIRIITDEKEMRNLLDVRKKWVISQSWNGWKKRDFDFNERDVEDVVEDSLFTKYLSNTLRPTVELHDDGKVRVHYPRECILETKVESHEEV